MAASAPTLWHRLDRLLVLVRPHRALLSLAVDGVVVGVCWNVTYLFRLGFERWIDARPPYDLSVMLAVVAIYLAHLRAAARAAAACGASRASARSSG